MTNMSVPTETTDPNPLSEWHANACRDEVRPEFGTLLDGGEDGQGALFIEADHREGLDGWWTKSFDVNGGDHYHFSALFRAENVPVPRRSVVVKIDWRDSHGKPVIGDQPLASGYLQDKLDRAQTEHPTIKDGRSSGWTEISDTYRAPAAAAQAIVELHLQWAPGGRVEWSNVSWTETAAPPSRLVRLATVHLRPDGRTPEENCRLYAPLIEEAARNHADLVVLGGNYSATLP